MNSQSGSQTANPPRFFDNNHTPLTGQALIGRRALVFNIGAGAFDREGTITDFDGVGRFMLDYGDAKLWYRATELLVPAVTDEMVSRGADALLAFWRCQGDGEGAGEQRRTARRHARVVLEAVIEGPVVRQGK